MQKTLVTLTAPSAAGKSWLLDYLRDHMGLPCLVSTTTRAPRAGEVEGRDYFFISHQRSLQIEQQGGFAELAEYRGVRYGVTVEEFHGKLNQGVAFLIVEPSGIDHYVAPALEVGARHLKFFIDVPLEVRLQRLQERWVRDLQAASPSAIAATVAAAVNRLSAVFTEEHGWRTSTQWTAVLDGQQHPQENARIIMEHVNNSVEKESVYVK